MNLDRWLAVIGLLVSVLGIAATYLWPTKKQIGVVALIVGVLVASWAIHTVYSTPAEAAPTNIFTGIVVDQANHKPIPDADVLTAQDQTLPEVTHNDNHGVFIVRLHGELPRYE